VDLEFTGIAPSNMVERSTVWKLSRADLARPVEESEVFIRYEGRIAGRTIVAFVVRESDVMFVRGGTA
jgi:hypothetical protein